MAFKASYFDRMVPFRLIRILLCSCYIYSVQFCPIQCRCPDALLDTWVIDGYCIPGQAERDKAFNDLPRFVLGSLFNALPGLIQPYSTNPNLKIQEPELRFVLCSNNFQHSNIARLTRLHNHNSHKVRVYVGPLRDWAGRRSGNLVTVACLERATLPTCHQCHPGQT